MAGDLTQVCAVVLHGGPDASGLADILHQFLTQTVAGDPARARRAARLRGALLFCAAEDPAVRVRIAFAAGRIDIADDGGDARGLPVITSDFLTTAHLTTGQEGPFRLLLARRLRVRLPWWRGPFLYRALRLMQLPPATPRPRPWLLPVIALLAGLSIALAAWWLLSRGGG